MSRSGVYEIRCINGKAYVGSSKDIHKRLREHRKKLERGTPGALSEYIKQHGFDAAVAHYTA